MSIRIEGNGAAMAIETVRDLGDAADALDILPSTLIQRYEPLPAPSAREE